MEIRIRIAHILLSVAATLFALDSIAYIETSDPGRVVVESAVDFTKPYKQRRSTHGFLLSVDSENYYPFDYQSQFGDLYVEGIMGEDPITLLNLEMGYKYNVSVGSVGILASYAQGKIRGSVVAREIGVTKQGLSANLALDAIFDEPWVAPYVQAGIHQFSGYEDNGTEVSSATAGIAFNYKYGVLFQIDWLENLMSPDSKAERLRSSGLDNAFIDVYFAEYLPSSGAQDGAVLGSDGDPNYASSGQMGFGLKLEF